MQLNIIMAINKKTMPQEIFNKLEREESTQILNRLNLHFDGTVFDPENTVILAQNLRFYPGYRLLEIVNHASMPEIRRYAVSGEVDFFILDFTNEPIYAFNQSLPIRLDENNIATYLRFFFSYVRGRHGRFIVIENIDEISWKDDPPPSARKAVGELITPIILEKIDPQGIFHLRVCMIFKDSLFKSLVKIEPNGFVSIHDEELLVEDMPILDDTFGQ